MRRLATSILFLSTILLGSIDSNAQIDLGFKGGLSIPNLTSGSSANPVNNGYGSRLAGDFSVQAEYHLLDRLSIQTQLEYSSQGGQKKGRQAFTTPAEMKIVFPPDQAPEYLYANYKSTAKINYLMLPLLAKYYFVKREPWRVYLAAGPFLSYVLSAKNITRGSSEIYLDPQETQALPTGVQSFDNNENIKSDLRRLNAGISGFVGAGYTWGRSCLFIEAGGNYGFIKIQRGMTNGKNNTGAAALTIGYSFAILP